jgi:hypothetical protein
MDETLKQAFSDWKNRKAYIDNNGNYHVKNEGKSSEKIASWNKYIKKMYNSVSEFHKAAITARKKDYYE